MNNGKNYILSIDQGTTSSRAIVYDGKCNAVSCAQAEYPQYYPRGGWVEQDPTEIYSSVAAVTAEALARVGINRNELAAIGITNQRETTIVWERSTGKPVYNAIVWQCRRTADICAELEKRGVGQLVYSKTGLTLDAYFSATKIAWIFDNVPDARKKAESGELLFGTVDTYLMWVLSAGKIHATDYTNASRTMLFDIHTLDWDDELLDLFGVPRRMLPECKPSASVFGYTDAAVFGAKVPISGVAGDQQAALFGQRCVSVGSAKITFGTGCFLLMNTGGEAVRSDCGLITTLTAAATENKPQYALEGSVFMGGAVVKWLRDSLRIVRTASETEKIALSVKDTGGVYFVPAFVGLGAPYWDPYARGTITGMTSGTAREHIVRAALESIAYQVNDVFNAMTNDCGFSPDTLYADGGASANNFLMRFVADITATDVTRPEAVEATALGAAYLAGLTVGVFGEQIMTEYRSGDKIFVHGMDEDRRRSLTDGWKHAVLCARR